MPTFDFMTLLWWGLPFAAAPVIIHLINLLRHRVVRWPAMEFLLASQRKYRTRILLKQILLLLLRILAIAGLALLFAQPRWDKNLGGVLGGNRTRHVVLLDDDPIHASANKGYVALVSHYKGEEGDEGLKPTIDTLATRPRKRKR